MTNNDIKKKAGELLKNMKSSGVNPQDISKLLSSPQIQKITKNLSDSDKQKLIQKFMNTSNGEISKNFKNADLSKISIDEIMKKLR